MQLATEVHLIKRGFFILYGSQFSAFYRNAKKETYDKELNLNGQSV